ncbi:Uncharacterized protein FWK35_00037502, partial [Aphis craccivora]
GILFKVAAVRRSGRSHCCRESCICYLHPGGVGLCTVSELRIVFHFLSRSAVRKCARNSCHDDVFTNSSYENQNISIALQFEHLNNRKRFSYGSVTVKILDYFPAHRRGLISFCTINERFFFCPVKFCAINEFFPEVGRIDIFFSSSRHTNSVQ